MLLHICCQYIHIYTCMSVYSESFSLLSDIHRICVVREPPMDDVTLMVQVVQLRLCSWHHPCMRKVHGEVLLAGCPMGSIDGFGVLFPL